MRALAWIRRRLKERPDSEHEMMPNRLVFAAVVLIYLHVTTKLGNPGTARILEASEAAFVVYLGLCAVIFAHMMANPGVSHARRIVAMVGDFAMMSFVAAVAGSSSGFLYPFYLWTVFGNGFRFGVRYIHVSMVVALASFAAVLSYTGFWGENLGLSIALLVTLLMLPLYAAVLIRKMAEAKRQAEEANRAKSLFLASVSHELRTPLNAVIGLSDLLREQPLQRQHREMVATIAGAGRTLLELITQVLDFSRIEAGRMPVNVADVDLYTLLHQIRAILRFQAESKGIDLAIEVTADTPRMVRADRRHLQELLVNLASNAVKFTSEGHVVIGVQPVESTDGQVRLRFEVSDTGIGIAPEAHGRIFESFTQADETIIDSHGGTGLGLAICRQLVQIHGGQIGLDSEIGRGSTFWFELPMTRSAEAAPEMANPKVILLGRDEELAERLRAQGCPVEVTATAEAAAATFLHDDETEAMPPLLVVDEDALDAPLDAATAALMEAMPAKPHAILVRAAGRPGGLLPGSSRSAYAAVVARPLDADELHAAISLASGTSEEDADGASSGAAEPARKLSILVAEDNRTNQMVIAKILEKAGHTVTLVDNGEQAVDTLRSVSFDIVLMDINMPVMNGIEATKLYRFAALGQKRIPIVALTADATDETRARCTEAGMDGCATKPIEARELLRLVAGLVAEEDDGREAGADAEQAAVVEETDGRVVALRDHPDFEEGVLRVEALRDLERLGGPEFVPELVRQFLGDARRLIDEVDAARRAGDVTAAREALHAMRSAAANVGAQRIYQTCLTWRRTTAEELREDGEARVAELRAELARARVLLTRYLGEAPEPVPFTKSG